MSLPYRGVPAPLFPAASTKTVGRAILLGSLCLQMCQAAMRKMKAKVFPFSVLQVVMDAPAFNRAKCEIWLTSSVSATAPSGKGRAQAEVTVSLHSSHSNVLPDRQFSCQHLNLVTRTEDICFSVYVYKQTCLPAPARQ